MTSPATVTPRVWSLEVEPLNRVLVTCAHPDDVDFGCSATVATLVDQGIEVAYCIATDGEAGGSDRAQSREDMAKIRRREQMAAAAVVGVSDVWFLGYPDGQLAPTLELRRDFTRVIRQFKPDLVIAQSPERRWDVIYASHPDHLAAGEAAIDAVYPDSRNPFAHPELLEEGLEPHTVPALWVMTPHGAANVVVDVTGALDRKVAALACHESQGGNNPDIGTRIGAWARDSAASAGLPEGKLAEAFLSVATS
jgi:LmbE family N-acetylglucosaminyl deacetylase